MKKSAVGTGNDNGVGLGGVKPLCGVMVAQPAGHKDRMVNQAIGAGEKLVHAGCLFANIIVVYAMQARHARVVFFKIFKLLHAKFRVRAESRVRENNGIDRLFEIEANLPSAKFKKTHKLGCPLVGTAPGTSPRTQIQGDCGHGFFGENRHQRGMKNGAASTQTRSPRI